MKIHAITFCKNEEKMIPFFLKHYSFFCDKITVYDNESTDDSVKLFKQCPKVEVISFSTEGKLNDVILQKMRNESYKQWRGDFDWQFIVDIDQFIYHPNLIEKLEKYKKFGITIPRIKGFQMFSKIFPTEDKQIYEIIQSGHFDYHLSIAAIFNPKLVDINYGPGCHYARPQGTLVYSFDEEIKLLHYRFLSYSYLINKCKERASELSNINKERNLGCHYEIFLKTTEEEFDNLVKTATNVFEEVQEPVAIFEEESKKDAVVLFGGGSPNDFKLEIKDFLIKTFPDKNIKILDVGAGRGIYYDLLNNYYSNIDCIEVYEPNIVGNKLKEKYKNVFLDDIRTFEFDFYDVIILGDILEHLTVEDAKKLLERIFNKCNQLIITVPWLYEQGAFYGNTYEIHLQPDLTLAVMKERYNNLFPIYYNNKCGVFIKNNEESIAYADKFKIEFLNKPDVLKTGVEIEICTKNRYFTTLPLCLHSIINQTVKPNKIVLYDDGECRDLRNENLYKNLFSLIQIKGIEWEVRFGPKKGQVYNHQNMLDRAQYKYVLRADDDNALELNVLESLLKIIKTDENIGAVGNLIIDPKNIMQRPKIASNKIEDIYLGSNIQWYLSDKKGIEDVDHLYSSFLYNVEFARKSGGYDLRTTIHREETTFTFRMKKAGYRILVDNDSTTWHYNNPEGGIRGSKREEIAKCEQAFAEELVKFKVVPTKYKFIVLDNGKGDHLIFKQVLPEIKEKYKGHKIIIACCFNDVFEDDKDVELMSIADANIIFGNVKTDSRFNAYKWAIENNWTGHFSEIFRRLYL